MRKNKILALLILLPIITLINNNNSKKVEAAGLTGIQQLSGTIKRETTNSPLAGGNTTTENIYKNTGIYFYGVTNNGASSANADIYLDSTSFYIDFSNIDIQYPSVFVISTRNNFSFQIKNSANNIVWYATQTIYTKTVNEEVVYQMEQNINGVKSNIDENKINPKLIGKKLITLTESVYTIDYTLGYAYYKSPNIFNTMGVKESFLNGKIYVDITKPVIKATEVSTGKAITNGSYTNKQIKINVTDSNYYRLYYTIPESMILYSTGSTEYTANASNGLFTFYATDWTGNKSETFTFYYDNILPEGKVNSQGFLVANNSYINTSFSYSATDSSGISICYIKRPNSTNYVQYTQGNLINKEDGDGWYSFFCVDNAGNTSNTINIYLETTKPLFHIYRNSEIIYSRNLAISESIDSQLFFNRGDELKITCNSSSGSVFSNYEFNKTYILDNSFIGQNHTINISSQLGINSSYTFHIIEQKPKLIIEGLEYESGARLYFKDDKMISWKYDNIITNTQDSGVTITSTGANIINHKYLFAEYTYTTLSTPPETETIYNIVITDLANNSSNYTIHINKSKPKCELLTSSNEILSSGSHTAKDVNILFDESQITAKYSYNNSVNFACESGEKFTQEGFYLITLMDLAGNTLIIEFTIDRTPPVGDLYTNYQKVDSNSFTNGKVYFTWEGTASATVNGIEYIKNSVIQADGFYTFILSDQAGNYNIYYITIITSSPSYNYEQLMSQKTLVSKWYNVRINEKLYSYPTYEKALEFAMQKERNDEVITLKLDNLENFTQHHLIAENDIVKIGTYYMYKSKANPNIRLYYFNENTLNEAIKFYANQFISGPHYSNELNAKFGECNNDMYNPYYISEYGMIPIVNNFIFTNYDTHLVYAQKIGASAKTIVAFEIPFKEQFNENGIYQITEIDRAGNETKYYVYFCLLAPTLKVNAFIFGQDKAVEMLIDNSKLSGIKDYYYESFSINEIFNGDQYAIVMITHNGKTNYYTKEDIIPILNNGGEYKITIYDRFNNSYAFNVFIVGEKPSINYQQIGDELCINITLNESFNTLTSLEIYHNGMKLDNVSAEKLTYSFKKSGTYEVIAKDNFGRIITQTYFFGKDKPVGTLIGKNQDNIAEEQVKITYDASKYFLEIYKDGLLLENNYSGTYSIIANLETEGNYVFKLIDITDESNFSNYEVKIQPDKTPPTITLNGVDNNGKTNGEVSITNPSEECSIIVYKDGKEIAYDFGDKLSEYGKYKVIITDKAGNQTVYNFEIAYKMNSGSITLIILAFAGVAALTFGFIIGKKKIYKRSKNK